MIVFTAEQKTRGEAFIARINTFMQSRYGAKALATGLEFRYNADKTAVVGVRAAVHIELPPDADGAVATPTKYLEIWD